MGTDGLCAAACLGTGADGCATTTCTRSAALRARHVGTALARHTRGTRAWRGGGGVRRLPVAAHTGQPGRSERPTATAAARAHPGVRSCGLAAPQRPFGTPA